jgi:nicotinamide mononucleotide (NMN) deamidase PncC
MLQPPSQADPAAWQRFFAMQANNSAWDLSTQPPGPDRTAALLDAAHASAWHWRAVGTELNRMRAAMLLAEAHALAGHGATALAYAREMRAYFVGRPDTPDWEIAFTHAVHAHAARAAGEQGEHRASYALAADAINAIANPKDREIVEQTFRQVPAP